MSEDYLAILQLRAPADADRLERAYRSSRARYERLTARGPLRFYRRDLLDDVEKAYRQLRKELPMPALSKSKYHKIDHPGKKPSILAQRAAALGYVAEVKKTVKSPVKKGSILSAEPLRLRSRTLSELRQPKAPETTAAAAARIKEREKSLVEDEFCREIIYRLEGDMIRYDSRQELIRIAGQRNIHLFRANMLIAQIVEAVRQNKLYQPSPAEQAAAKKNKRRRRWTAALVVGAILLAAVIDWLLIRYLG